MGKRQFRDVAFRLFWLCAGILLFVVGLTRTMPQPHPIWRRLLALGGGGFFIYIASAYYFPRYRKQREELKRELDEGEREIEEIERRAQG